VQSRILHNCEFCGSYHCLVITMNEILAAMMILVGAHPCERSNVYRYVIGGGGGRIRGLSPRANYTE
jgi:hypothetical protein